MSTMSSLADPDVPDKAMQLARAGGAPSSSQELQTQEQEEERKEAPAMASEAVMVESVDMPADAKQVRGYDFNQGIDYDALLKSYMTTGFQATSFAQAVEQVNEMINWRLSDEPELIDDHDDISDPSSVKCTIFLGFTSNMISCGVRETIRYLAEHKMVDCMVTTGGAVEEDIMKCLNPTYMGSFTLPGAALRDKGLNRIGNTIVPNKNYVDFEAWMEPVLKRMLKEQREDGTIWSPSKMIRLLGEQIDNPDSVWYWCFKNDIPVYCPAIIDGSIGDMIYFHTYRDAGLIMDTVQDIRSLNDIAVKAKKTGALILGGGVVKHQIMNANLMRNGADFSVFINTAQDFDGSDSGALPDEAVSWGKIKAEAQPVKMHAEASFVFPLLVAQTFAQEVEKRKQAAAEASAKEQ